MGVWEGIEMGVEMVEEGQGGRCTLYIVQCESSYRFKIKELKLYSTKWVFGKVEKCV